MTRQKTVETRSHLQVHSAGIREPGPVRHDWNDKKQSRSHSGSALFSVLGGDLALADTVELTEFLQITGRTDQHDLAECSGVDILKSCDLFPGADAGADHRLLVFLVIGLCLWLFLEKHPVPLLNPAHPPTPEMPQWRLRSEPAAPGQRSQRASPPSADRSCRIGRGYRPRFPRCSPCSRCGPPRSG